MAPIPSSPLLLVLTFPSLDSLLSTRTFGPRIADAARSTSSLLLLIKFAFPFPTHSNPSIPSPKSTLSASTGTASGSGSSSSSSRAPTADDEGLDAFHLLEPLLSHLYSAATKVFVEEDRPLDTVDAVLESMRGFPICWKEDEEHRRKETFLVGEQEPETGRGRAEGGWEGQYDDVALGGTFDHLHAGHKILLSLSAFLTARRLIVGVTDAQLLANKVMAQHLETLQTRIAHVRSFLELIRPGIIHDVVPIEDVYGPTAWDEEIRALVVSDETRKGGAAVNAERSKKSLNELDVFVIKLIGQEGGAEGTVETKMGSTGIRKWIDAKQRT